MEFFFLESIVESKSEGWFCKNKNDPPEVPMNKHDKDDNDWGISWMKLGLSMVGYALGKRGGIKILFSFFYS